MFAGRVLATQQARDAAKQLLALTVSMREQVGRVIQQGGVLADSQQWDGGLAGRWRNDWGLDANHLHQTAAKLDELEHTAQQAVEDIYKADSGTSAPGGSQAGDGGSATFPQMESAVARFRELLDKAGSFELDGNRNELREIAEIIQGLSPAEREAFLVQLSDEDLRTWRQYQRDTSDILWINNGLPHWDRLDLDTSLLSGVSRDSVDRLSSVWPELQPTPPDGSEYTNPGGPLDDGSRSWDDVNQGGVGDCWALATLAGQGRQDPSFYDKMVRQNPNGTVSVRLYDDSGNPHWITVTGDLPVKDGALAGASGDSVRNSDSAENWPAYVEKALARAYDDGDESTSGYENIDRDWPDQSVEILTGKDARNIEASDASTAGIGDRVDSGQVVIVSTEGSDQGPYVHSNDSGNLVGGHAYFVKDVLPDGRVVLGNPWGSESPDGEVILTQEEIREHGTKVTVED